MSNNTPAKLLRVLKRQLGLRHLTGIQTGCSCVPDTRLSALSQALARLPVGAQLDLFERAARKLRRRPTAEPAELIAAALSELEQRGG
jgi:hypothetical protein